VLHWTKPGFDRLRKAENVYETAKSIGDNLSVARFLAVIANIYETMNQLNEALKYYQGEH
jgi:hypothetical protein